MEERTAIEYLKGGDIGGLEALVRMHHTRAVRAVDLMWRPSTAPTGFQVDEPLPVNKLEDGCWSLTMKDPAEGSSGVKVP